MSEFERRPSHYDHQDQPIPLSTHLGDVAERVGSLVPEDATTPENGSLRDLTRRVAYVHDFGKLTTWFQQHLSGATDPEGPTNHSPLGALVAHYVLSASGYERSDPLIGFLTVAKHHGQLPDTAEYVRNAAAEVADSRMHQFFRKDTFEQVRNIDGSVPDLADDLIVRATDGEGSWDEFVDLMETAEQHDEFVEIAEHVLGGLTLTSLEPERLPDNFYDVVVQAWSGLVFADKTSAAALTTNVDLGPETYAATRPDRTAIDRHVAALQRTASNAELDSRTRRLNRDRERARQEARERAETFVSSSESIATLTLPTGLGKTLTGLDAALTVLAETERDGRLVYALPFTSIIDQVVAESAAVFAADEQSGLLTVDHHLSETVVSPNVDAEAVAEDTLEHVSAMLGNSWRSGMVVTTFVQLFESLAGPSNGQSMKLPSLYGSVVVLDEPQALPLDWWPLVERLGVLLTEEYDATVIAMTATQPKLFTTDGEPFRLIDDPGPYFEPLDRLTFDLHGSVEAILDGESNPVEYAQAARSIGDRLRDEKSALAICNTIDSARELAAEVVREVDPIHVNERYGSLLQTFDGWSRERDIDDTVDEILTDRSGSTPLLIHLTTRHRPVDRAHLIDVAIELTERDIPVVFISTQLVEAGVDVSFDSVFRDFAPLDSIVQAAGRCNRSFDRSKGRVLIWELAPPTDREYTPSRSVYGRRGESLTKLTARALGGVYSGTPIAEPRVTRDAVQAYFDLLDERDVGTDEYAEFVNRAEAAQLGRLSLIDAPAAVDVLVGRTEREWETIVDIERAYNRYDWAKVDDLLEKTKHLQVSIPVYSEDDQERIVHCTQIHPDTERRRIDARPNRDAGFFDCTDGVVIPESTVEARLL